MYILGLVLFFCIIDLKLKLWEIFKMRIIRKFVNLMSKFMFCVKEFLYICVM